MKCVKGNIIISQMYASRDSVCAVHIRNISQKTQDSAGVCAPNANKHALHSCTYKHYTNTA